MKMIILGELSRDAHMKSKDTIIRRLEVLHFGLLSCFENPSKLVWLVTITSVVPGWYLVV